MRTFVHHDGSLGDVLLSLPCLRKLREGAGTLHLAGRPDIGRLLRESGTVEEASDSGSARYAGLYAGQADRDLAAFLAGFDRAVVFTVDAGGPANSAIGKIIADRSVVITMPPPASRVSAARFRLGQLAPDADLDREPLLNIPTAYRELSSAMLTRWGWKGDGPLVMVHPGSGGRNKRWPLDRFFSLVGTFVAEQGAFVVISTGPAEDDRFLDQVENFSRGQERAIHIGDTDLPALAALLGHCDVYVGNDSGVSHLAAAVGAPTVALFGPTDPVVWGPVGRRVKVVSAASLEAISVEEVREAAQTYLPMRK